MVRAHVIGGGVAGLTAALALRDHGFDVDLYEAHGWLGGRAFSPRPSRRRGDAADAYRLDNGPHVMLGAYDHTISLCERLGTADGFVVQPSLRIAYRDEHGESSQLALTSWLPAPVAFPPALLTHAGFRLRARLRALLGLGLILLGAPRSWSLETWMHRTLQRGQPDEWIWRPMCRAIMNAEPADVSASLFFATLRRAFLGSAKRAGIWLPDRPWGQLIGEPAERSLRAAGIVVHLHTRVGSFVRDGGRIEALKLGSGERERTVQVHPGDLVVSAMPWQALARLLPDPALAGVAEIPGSPITSVWFEIDPERMPKDVTAPEPLTVLVGGGPFHFLYRRPSDPAGRFALLNGGGAGLTGGIPEWTDLALEQVRRCLPEMAPALGATGEGVVTRVTREQAATFVARPGAEDARPKPGLLDGFVNLVVCGDWTATGLPSTLEGAAESAVAAVRTVIDGSSFASADGFL
jgi:squalene-associated FAD-dependent desaturase